MAKANLKMVLEQQIREAVPDLDGFALVDAQGQTDCHYGKLDSNVWQNTAEKLAVGSYFTRRAVARSHITHLPVLPPSTRLI